MKAKPDNYVIGVDGGGTKTVAALADLAGRILKIGRAGSSSPRNVGIKRAAQNIAQAIKKAFKKGKNGRILSTFVGLPAVEEEYRSKKEEIKKEILKQKGISPILKGTLIIGSDQITAFRAGTKEKEGIMLIAGTGCAAHGWKGNRETKCTGWGWLADEGAAFWVGQKVFQAIFKELDGRGPKTLLTKMVFQKLKTKIKENLSSKIYSKNPTETIPLFSVFCDSVARKGDRVAKAILLEAARELALSLKTVIKKLDFKKQKFPVVLVGGMFKSKIVLDTVQKEVKKIAPGAQFIQPKKAPAIGAVRLAIEQLNGRDSKNKSKKPKENN